MRGRAFSVGVVAGCAGHDDGVSDRKKRRPVFLKNLFLSAPPAIDASRYSLCVVGPLALGLSLGVQVMMTAFLLFGPSDTRDFGDQLTEYGKRIARPEHDLSIFVAGATSPRIAARRFAPVTFGSTLDR